MQIALWKTEILQTALSALLALALRGLPFSLRESWQLALGVRR